VEVDALLVELEPELEVDALLVELEVTTTLATAATAAEVEVAAEVGFELEVLMLTPHMDRSWARKLPLGVRLSRSRLATAVVLGFMLAALDAAAPVMAAEATLVTAEEMDAICEAVLMEMVWLMAERGAPVTVRTGAERISPRSSC